MPQPEDNCISKDQIDALIGLYNQGRLQDALAQGLILAERYPNVAFVPDLLGAVYVGLGRKEDAVASFRKALEIKPDSAATYNNLGNILHDLGKHKEAVANYRRALAVNPDYAEAHYNVGNTLSTLGKYGDAVAAYLRAVALKPDYVEAHNNLGFAFNSLGRYEEAVLSYRRALDLQPGNLQAHYRIGNTLGKLGKHEEAIASYQRALELDPLSATIHSKLGRALVHIGRHEQAVASYRRALELKADYVEAHNSLGNALSNLGRYEAAVASYNKALAIKPDYAEAYNNLGVALDCLGDQRGAIASYQRALDLRPDYAEAHYNLGNTCSALGRREEAIVSYRAAVDLNDRYLSARGSLLHQLAQICDWVQIGESIQSDLLSLEFGRRPREVISPFSLLALVDDARFHRSVSEAFALSQYKPNPVLGPISIRRNVDRIRIGYFSADFHNHATMYLMAELFERHDRGKFEIHAFSFGPEKKDEMRSRLLNAVEVFHDVRQKGDIEIAALSRSLGIDIAVDLKGYTTEGRTGIFSYRAAPIQVNYLGYPGTMGVPYIDYVIADPVLIPTAFREFYSEKVAYLPGCYQVNDSTRDISGKAMSRSEFGLPENGFVFCCFNNNYKITPDVFDIWMRLLGKVDGSVLWLLKANPLAERNLRKEAANRGIDPERLIFAERMQLSEHLARHRFADLFLDTFNYNAHTTASDALWAGLPVLTRTGESFASRVAGSLLRAAGLPELITTTAREYEDTALRLATHPHDLKYLRAKLQKDLPTKELFDAALFTKHIEAAYTHMIKRLEEGLQPDHFYVEK